MAISKFQRFEAVTIKRGMIKNAPYNPRKIGDAEAKALRKSIKTHGLVETLVWNEKTGHLVGGHQRLSQLDALEGRADYELTIAKVSMSLKQEKELNIALNNPSLQGEYDMDLLKSVLDGIDVENTGFTEYDLSVFGIDQDIEEIEEDATPESEEETKARIAEIKEAKQRSKEKNIMSGENYVVLTFSSVEAKESFMDRLGYEPDDRYMKGENLYKKLFGDGDNEDDEISKEPKAEAGNKKGSGSRSDKG